MTIVLLGCFFLLSMQPIMMIISMILIVLLYSLVIYEFMGSYWFGYALILVLLSGVLVVFMYMISLVPNESFEVYSLIFIMLILIVLMNKSVYGYMIDFSFVSLNLWFSYIGMFNLFLVVLLLSVMIMVVWLSYFNKVCLRLL